MSSYYDASGCAGTEAQDRGAEAGGRDTALPSSESHTSPVPWTHESRHKQPMQAEILELDSQLDSNLNINTIVIAEFKAGFT